MKIKFNWVCETETDKEFSELEQEVLKQSSLSMIDSIFSVGNNSGSFTDSLVYSDKPSIKLICNWTIIGD
jgi:hypothetical protein